MGATVKFRCQLTKKLIVSSYSPQNAEVSKVQQTSKYAKLRWLFSPVSFRQSGPYRVDIFLFDDSDFNLDIISKALWNANHSK